MKKRIYAALLGCVLALTLVIPALATESGDIVVFYTNDIHTYIDNDEGDEPGLTYGKVAALKAAEKNAVLVDAGDHVQGTAYGSMDKGATMIALMNAAGYDVATLGNHEFDYGMEGCMAAIEAADFPYVSCNFYHEENGTAGEPVLDSFVTVDVGGKTIAFVGITTPETITSSTPSYFQNEAGEYIYGIAAGTDGGALYAAVQTAIDAARKSGADYVIALGHLGVDPSSVPWTSREVIAHTTGLDAFIDGHSHTTIEGELVTDKDGQQVVLTQTGSYLNAVGKMTISASGEITTKLLTAEDVVDITPNAEVAAIEQQWIGEIDERLGEVIGYAAVTLDNYDSDGNRLVRRQETNTGDFTADALYWLFESMDMDVDVAVVNGGGIRNAAVTGEVTYRTCKEIHTFGNVVCLQAVTGQQLLDALEWGVKDVSATEPMENGGFLQVSGVRFTVDLSVPSTVQADEKDVWTGAPTGEYRVKNVEILDRDSGEYVPLDVNATYHLAGQNYILRNGGNGFAMFDGAVNVLDYVAEDYMALADYVKSFPVDESTGLPTIPADSVYSDVNGSGRITIVSGSGSAAASDGSYTVAEGDCLWHIALTLYGDGCQWTAIYEANRSAIDNPDHIYPGLVLTLPAA